MMDSVINCPAKGQISTMRVKFFPFEKFLLFLFYLESMILMEQQHKHYFWGVVMVVAIVSYTFEGGRPYSPLFFGVALADYYDMTLLQMGFIVVMGFLIAYLKFYHIEIVGKGPYNAGYRQYKHQNINIGVFYPSMSNGSNPKWIPSQKYNGVLYDIFYVDPATYRIPYAIFRYLVSFLFKFDMPVLGDASLYVNDYDKNEKWTVIVFSHGLGSNLNNYSALCGWWASHGYIVVCIQHDHDHVRIDFPNRLRRKTDELVQELYSIRNADIIVRAKETRSVYQQILEGKLLSHVFKQVGKMELEAVYLGGHSFGAGTAMETLSSLIEKGDSLSLLKGVICLDPWFFPMSESTYERVQDQNLLIISTDTFLDVQPYFYGAHQRLLRVKEANKLTSKPFMITNTDHLAISDFVFTFGKLFKVMKVVTLQELAKPIIQLHQVAISLFMEGKSKNEIESVSNKFAAEKGLIEKGVMLKEEWRYSSNYKQE